MSDQSPSRDFAFEIVKRLRQAGYQALWAGGSVRDLMLGPNAGGLRRRHGATPEQVMAALPYRALTVGISFGVVRVRHPRQGGVEVEVATFRSDGAYVDGRRPESVVFGSPELDAARRDFTINGMFMDPLSGEVIDFVGGQADLENHILRAIGDPVGPLDAKTGFAACEPSAWPPGSSSASSRRPQRRCGPWPEQITGVSAERIAQELRRMLVHSSRVQAMNLALETGLVAAILPPLVPMKGLFQGKPMQPEGDLWDHTMLVLDLLPPDPSFTLAFAALLHDAGKPALEDDAPRPLRLSMARAGRRQDRRATRADALKLSNAERESGSPGWSPSASTWERPGNLRESKLKRILAASGNRRAPGPARADALASFGSQRQTVDYCRRYIESATNRARSNPPPLINGHDLVPHGLKPNALLRDLARTASRCSARRSRIHSKREALEWVDRQLASRRDSMPLVHPEPDSSRKG